ncbi:MAG: hypothetical protein ABSE89_00430 [Sedimentisphaerales bacterium]
MRFRDIVFIILCIAAAAGLAFWGSRRLDNINAQRSEMKLIMNQPLENAPPSLAFATVALGAFRGLIVDILWLRADQLKEEGKFFDAKQLAEWITILQPRFAEVWNFHAWNMAYNISVAIPASRPQERWQWVKNGIELLRDKGIEKNPRSIILYHELGWIFQQKIGGVTDDVHKYYKLQLYHSMKPLVEPQTEEHFKGLAAAPQSLDEILQKPDVAKFVKELASADNAFAKPGELVDNYLSLRQQPQRFSKEAFAVIDNYRNTKTLEDFDTFAKAYYLRHTWKLEPQLMVQLNEKYGPIDYKDPNKLLPLDWTLPDSQAIYWASLGLQRASKPEFSTDELNTDRIVFHSIQNLYRQGKMVVYTSRMPAKDDPCNIIERESVFLFPDLRMFDRYEQTLRALMGKYKKLEGNVESLQIAHKNMLKHAILLFYQAGNIDKAAEIYKTVKEEYPEDRDIQRPFFEYVKETLIRELSTMGITDVSEILALLLREAYYRYAVHEDEEAYGRERLAREIYDQYEKQLKNYEEGVDRVQLPDFEVLRYIGITGFLSDQRYPDFVRQNLVERLRIERPELYEKMNQQNEFFMREMEKQESQQK